MKSERLYLPERIKTKGGTLFRVPFLFRGVVRGKRFMIEGGLGSYHVFSNPLILASKSNKKYHIFIEMSNEIY